MKNKKAKSINIFDAKIDSVLGEFYDEEEKNVVDNIEARWQYTINDIEEELYRFRDIVIEHREDVISQRALDSYNSIIQEINHFLGEDDWEDDFVPDEKHFEELKEARRIAALNQQLEDLETERQRYLEAIQESEALISKLKEKNVDPSIIADEKALIEKNKSCIEELNQQISALHDTLSTNK